MQNQQALTAAAARRRSFAAAMKKGSSGKSDDSPKQAGAVAGLDATSANAAPPQPSPYGVHAAHLAHAAHHHGHPKLASAIVSVAHTPHPADKMQVARNYLATVPDDEKAAHAHMFTPTLMAGPK